MNQIKPLPDMSDCENFTESEIFEYINELIERLKNSKETLDKIIIKDLLVRISSSYFDYEEYLEKICEEFINKDLVETLCYFLKVFYSSLNVNDDILNYLINGLINFSDYSVNFARAVCSSEIISLVIDNCLNKKFTDNLKDKNTIDYLENCVTLIHNIARDPGNAITHDITEFKHSLVRFIKYDSNSKLGMVSMLTLSYIVEEEEISLLNEGSNTIKLLFRLIKKTSSLPKRSGNFTIPEIMRGIYYISSNDKMKEKIYEYDGIPILIDILRDNVENEIEYTLGIIWNLCFVEKVKQALIKDYQIEEIIKPFANHSCLKIKENHDGIMWKIQNEKEMFHEEEKATKQMRSPIKRKMDFDVFISYAHENQSKILEIRDNLIKYNIRVWIDKEQMTGSILEAMARGIENSKVIIIGMSRYYMTKPNCRSEAEYAYQKQKPIIPMIMEYKFKPEGWLGILQGTKLYFEFSERRNTEEVLGDLVKSIERSLTEHGIEESKIEVRPIEWKESEKTSKVEMTESKINEIIKNWTRAEVIKWLEQSKLDHMKKRLNDLDGSLLLVMLNIRLKSPEYFNKTLKNEFGMKFMDVMKFHRALDDLASI